MSIYMEVTTLKVRKYFYGTIFIEYSLVLYVCRIIYCIISGRWCACFYRLSPEMNVGDGCIPAGHIWIDLVSGHTGYVPLVFQAKSGSILKNWYIFCCILDEGDILLSLILRLPEMRPTFARNRLASRWMRRYNKQRCEFLGPSAILAEYTYALEETSRPKGHPRWAYEKSHAPNQSPQCDDTNYFVGKRLDELLLGLQCLIRAGSTTAARPVIWYSDTFGKLHLAVAKITSWSSWNALSFIQKHAIIKLQFEFLFTSSCRREI